MASDFVFFFYFQKTQITEPNTDDIICSHSLIQGLNALYSNVAEFSRSDRHYEELLIKKKKSTIWRH